MKLIGLVELARRTGMSRARLLTQLRALEESTPNLRKLVVVHVGKHRKIWVNAAVLDYLNDLSRRELQREVQQLRARVRQLEVRADECEAARCA